MYVSVSLQPQQPLFLLWNRQLDPPTAFFASEPNSLDYLFKSLFTASWINSPNMTSPPSSLPHPKRRHHDAIDADRMYVYYWRTYDKAVDVEGGCRESNPGNMATAASPKGGCVWSVAETPVARAHSARTGEGSRGRASTRTRCTW